jgi:hypothetical protein
VNKALTREKFRRLLEILSIGVAISGISLGSLRSEHPKLWAGAVVVVIAVLVSVLFSWRKTNEFSSKGEIDRAWQNLIGGAAHCVQVFAGDASWAERDHVSIATLTQRHVEVSVLCHPSKTNLSAQESIKLLLESGAKVRFFDPREYPYTPYGLLIDAEDRSSGTALVIGRTPKPSISPRAVTNIEIYDYKASRLVQGQDGCQVSILSALFWTMWLGSQEALILRPTDLDTEHLIELLRLVPHYRGLKRAAVDVADVDVDQLLASCLYVKQPKLASIGPIMSAFSDQQVPEFRTVLCIRPNQSSLLLPPILEEHDGKLVVVDGTHRLFHLFAIQQRSRAMCVVVSGAPELPGRPIPFREVKSYPRKLRREEIFIGYVDSYYRNFDPMDRKLASWT